MTQQDLLVQSLDEYAVKRFLNEHIPGCDCPKPVMRVLAICVLREQGAAPQESVGPNPTDREKNGSKRHLLVDGRGVSLSLVVTGANRHDVSQLESVLDALVVERANPPLRRHKHLCANAGYTGAPALKVIEEHSYIPHAVLPHTAPASGV